MEKEYTFCLDKGIEGKKDIIVKESELSKPQLELLLARLYEVWNNVPTITKRTFITELSNALPTESALKPNVESIRDGLGD